MIETQTHWKDSGFDCDHCGGQIMRRIDYETGQPPRECYQCAQCGCQWQVDGNVKRVGSGPQCKKAQQARSSDVNGDNQLTRRFVIILSIVAFLLIARYGGFAALRFLIPVAIAVVILIAMARFAREKGWW